MSMALKFTVVVIAAVIVALSFLSQAEPAIVAGLVDWGECVTIRDPSGGTTVVCPPL